MKKDYFSNYVNIYWFGILAIVLAISSPWFDLSVSNHSFVKTYFAGIGVGILVLMTLFNKYKNYKLEVKYHISYIKVFFGATFLLGLFSLLWSTNPDFSITKLLIWITIFMAFYSAYNLNITEDVIFKFSTTLVIAAGLIAIIGILQYLFDPFSLTQAANPSSTFGNKNMATQPISMIFPLSVFLILRRGTSHKILWMAGIFGALMLTFNFYTFTRASWIAVSGEIFLMTGLLIIKRKSFNEFASWNREKTIVALTSIVLFFILISFNEYGFNPFWEKATANFDRLTNSISNDKSLRYQIWATARQMIEASPFFGTGLGTWFHNLVQEGYSTHTVNYVQRVHNDLIEMAVSIGLVGVSVFLMGVMAVIYAIWKIITKANNKFLLFYFALFEALSGSFVNMQFSFPYQLAMPALIFGFYIGLIARKSEEFIEPIKVFKLNLTKQSLRIYKNSILAINVVIFIVITSIYISWAGMYSGLDKLNMQRDFDKLNLVETPIYHLEIQNIMNFLSSAYINGNSYDVAEKVVLQMLKYWPNDYVTRTRYAHILYKKKHYNRAILEGKKAQKSSPINFLHSSSILFNLYSVTGNNQAYIKLFKTLSSVPEEIMSQKKDNYKTLLSQALRKVELYKYVPQLYALHNKYDKYDCGVESNIMYYYLATKQSVKLITAFEEETKNTRNCLNKNLVNRVKLLKSITK